MPRKGDKTGGRGGGRSSSGSGGSGGGKTKRPNPATKSPGITKKPRPNTSTRSTRSADGPTGGDAGNTKALVLTMGLSELYGQCTADKGRRRNLDAAEEGGVLELRLWPIFLRAAVTGAETREDKTKTKKKKKKEEEEEEDGGGISTSDAAHLVCLLVNRRSASGSSSGGSASTPGGSAALSFVAATSSTTADKDGGDANDVYAKIIGELDAEQVASVQSRAFGLVVSNLLGRNDMSIEDEAEVVHFFVSAFASLDLRSSHAADTPSSSAKAGQPTVNKRPPPILAESLSKITSIGIWESMPERYRDLELKKSAMLRRRWGAWKKMSAEDTDAGSASLVTYLPHLVDTIFGITEDMAVWNDEDGAWGKPMEVDEDDDNTKVKKGGDAASDKEGDDDTDDEGEPALPDPQRPHPRRAGESDTAGSSARRIHSRFALLNRSLELLADLLLLPPARRHVRPYLLSRNFAVRLSLSAPFLPPTSLTPAGRLFRQLHAMLVEAIDFGYDDATGSSLTDDEVASRLHERAHILQKLCHRHYADSTSDIIYAGVARVCDPVFLKKNLDLLELSTLKDLCRRLRLVDIESVGSGSEEVAQIRSLLTSALLHHHTYAPTGSSILASLPLYPDESLLWNPHLVPPGHVGRHSTLVLALPKLNVSFLTHADYLLRSFKLLRLESAYGIRSDLVDVVKRMRPSMKRSYDDAGYGEDAALSATGGSSAWDKTSFQGWARMGIELAEPVRLRKVSPPELGKTMPAEVIAEVTIDLKHSGDQIRKEWDEIGEFDNLFLLSIDATRMSGEPAPMMESYHGFSGKRRDAKERRVPDEEDVTFPRRFGVTAVRGCMVLEVRDQKGTVLTDPSLAWQQPSKGKGDREGATTGPKGTKRILRVAFDAAQYALDATGRGSPAGTGVYETLNLLVRRHGRENNFKSVLETIRSMLEGTGSVHRSIPQWLQPTLLGVGDPSAASFESRNMREFARKTAGVTSPDAALDYGDTFLDANHLIESFPDCKILVDGSEKGTEDAADRKRYTIKVTGDVASENRVVEAASYPHPLGLPGNPVRFTPRQVEAIRSGLSPGLTLIVGPPGTGKTDVAVQIIANIYQSFPTQRTILVTHSNAALNDLFEKVMARGDVDERYLLRLGSGERDLKTDSEHDFTKQGRVAHILSRRAALLEKVQLLSEALGVSGPSERGPDGSPSYTCETAEYFNLHHVQKRVQMFEKKSQSFDTANVIQDFPFRAYFCMNVETTTISLDDARKKLAELQEIFTELAEYRPLELLRSQRQRTDYLLTKQARIVAMTCTHAAIVRSHLIELGFQYDNVIMEEAGQMLDVETVIPLLLQKGESDGASSSTARLKRVCLIGDHHQLPPVIKNQSFSKFSHLDQSLFTRLIRHGVPSLDLNRQGRARADIAKLYSWRYRDLGDLDNVLSRPDFQVANTGFAHTFQFIDVDDFEGRGESTPTAYFYQNMGEAEYVVALFQFMVLIGIPAEKISILTTYNGQKSLLDDIINQRCGPGTPLAGVRPGAVSTVDHYQGQQNDFILLSLVRTNAVGHLRDVRRLVVAVSRARLGLYVFGRRQVFDGCHELRFTMGQFWQRPDKLELVTGEHYPTGRKLEDDVAKDKKFIVENVTSLGEIVHSMQSELCS